MWANHTSHIRFVWFFNIRNMHLGGATMEHTYSRGEIYYAHLTGTIGSEQNGYRPVVIIQNDVGNRFSPTVIVAPISSKVGIKAKLPTHCYIGDELLSCPSIVMAEQLRTIDKNRLTSYVGRLSVDEMVKLNSALLVSLGLPLTKEA